MADDLARENEELRHRLREAEELIVAVRTGAVDALAIHGADGPRIFTLQGADEGYRTLIEQMNEGALLLSREGTVLYGNAALVEPLGYSLVELLGSTFESLVPLNFRAYWADLVARGWAGRARGELPLQSLSGLLWPFAVSMSQLTFDGTPALAVLVTDLSAQQEITNIRALVAEQNALICRKDDELLHQQAHRQTLEHAAAEARRILESIPQIAWTAMPDGKCSYVNARWVEFAGPKNRLTKSFVTDHIHPDEYAPTIAIWQHSLATGQPLDVECRLRDATGGYHWMLGRALPSRNEHGHITQWIGTFTDIHEQKLALEREAQAQAQLRENNEQLTRVNVDLDNFVYTASHDLKGPITNIEGLLHALLTELPLPSWASPQVPLILDMMQDSVNRFKRTIGHLTAVAEIKKEPAHGPAPVLVDLLAVVDDVRLDLAPQLQAAGGHLTVAGAGCPPVSFSEKNLRSVVYNLLSNAIKYRSPARPLRISLTCQPVGTEVVLAVQDNGLGLNLAGESRLFAMFQRLHDHVEGSGIGLYMVKKMVENAGGRIEVQSQVGVGSTFTVYFRR